MESQNELKTSDFILFFQVKSGRLICDGKNRTFSNVYQSIQNQWEKISEKTRNSYKNQQFMISDISKGRKCEDFYQLILENLKFYCQSQDNSKDAINPCKFCKKTFQNLNLHLITKHPEHIYPKQSCNQCKKSFVSPQDFFEHFVENHSDENNKAVEINAEISTKNEKKEITDEIPKYECKECQISFGTVSQFKYHRLKVHGKWQGKIDCKTCSKQFSTMSNLRKHEKIAHNDGKLKLIFLHPL